MKAISCFQIQHITCQLNYKHTTSQTSETQTRLIVPLVVFNHNGQSCLPLLQIDYDLISLRFQLIIKRQSFTDCCLLLKLYLTIFKIRYNTNNYSLRDSIFFSKYLLRIKFLTPLLKNNESVKVKIAPHGYLPQRMASTW